MKQLFNACRYEGVNVWTDCDLRVQIENLTQCSIGKTNKLCTSSKLLLVQWYMQSTMIPWYHLGTMQMFVTFCRNSTPEIILHISVNLSISSFLLSKMESIFNLSHKLFPNQFLIKVTFFLIYPLTIVTKAKQISHFGHCCLWTSQYFSTVSLLCICNNEAIWSFNSRFKNTWGFTVNRNYINIFSYNNPGENQMTLIIICKNGYIWMS